ncbi:TlpA family protein disulfide reductase [Nocardia panacis]|uniref:TlpA family protein disulfide reductase n=1 Tax=Nocardia panacis TaxID=2340916 RepID=A0A3A4KT44_9NOCA|nr:TlpA disulfide reductase family protein [Nocardia panacis]RJO78060.1 TlpA family protein disulfide reductase [Nocardia panacis]
MPAVWRWALLVAVALVALAVALWPRGGSRDAARPAGTVESAGAATSSDRAAAGLPQCPRPAPDAVGRGPLAGLTLDCLADGSPVDLAAALAGKPAVLNLWAYWCGPCRKELPDLSAYAARAGTAVTVLTVHADPAPTKGLGLLAALRQDGGSVRIPGVEDADGKVRAAVGAPNVLPVTVLLRADGSIAKTVVRPFAGVEDIVATVAAELGVAA